MRKLSSFNFITLNGYYKGLNDDISWHDHSQEGRDFSEENLKPRHALLFGRRTFEMMRAFWCSDQAMQQMPEITKGMHESHKYVFSHSLQKTDWENSTLVKEEMIDFVRKLKQTEGPDLTILGSGEILTQLADAHLVDRYDIMLDPVILGGGGTIFQGVRENQDLKLVSQKSFKNGALLLSYDVSV